MISSSRGLGRRYEGIFLMRLENNPGVEVGTLRFAHPSGPSLATARRQRLLAAMEAAGIDEIAVYGNAWQGDYLRYVADFGILEGHGIAVIAADGATELFLDSATDAERAEAETPGVAVRLAGDIARA